MRVLPTGPIIGEMRYFLTLPEEQLLVAQRKHWVVLFMPLCLLFCLFSAFLLAFFYLFLYFLWLPTLFIASISFIFVMTMSFLVKIITDWYLHLFVVTTRKILEVCCCQLFSYKITEVLLDQVRCTEISQDKKGILNEVFDKGNIVITYDGPMHKGEFTFTDIPTPTETSAFLSDIFSTINTKDGSFASQIVYKREESIPLNPFLSKGYI